ncbi:hypothetical protein ACJU26_06790 [Acidithiobacillus sp. M4-SHS-6]|uniref:hypothetical protein n=1 Tax=Acidithiobacillus sp. M4-SHS-6 TaxID=3383024 RepID=UPI0039BE1B52
MNYSNALKNKGGIAGITFAKDNASVSFLGASRYIHEARGFPSFTEDPYGGLRPWHPK